MTSLRPRCCTFWANRSPPPPSTTAVSPATVCGCRSYAVSYKILSRDAKAMGKVKALRIAETNKVAGRARRDFVHSPAVGRAAAFTLGGALRGL